MGSLHLGILVARTSPLQVEAVAVAEPIQQTLVAAAAAAAIRRAGTGPVTLARIHQWRATTVAPASTSLPLWAVAAAGRGASVPVPVVGQERPEVTVQITTTELGRMNSVAAVAVPRDKQLEVRVATVEAVLHHSATQPRRVLPTRGAAAEVATTALLLPLALAALES
jgi:hypothetical protein